MFDHLGIPAEVGGGVCAGQVPEVGIFADDVFHATGLTSPFGVFVRAAHGWNVSKPRYFRRQLCEFFVIAVFPGAACPVNKVQMNVCREMAVAPIPMQRAHVRNERSDAGDGAEQ